MNINSWEGVLIGESFLRRKALVGPQEELGLGEGRRERYLVGRQQESKAHPRGVFPELSEVGRRCRW